MAIARFSIASEAGTGSGEDVGVGGLFKAIERRRLMSGSDRTVRSIFNRTDEDSRKNRTLMTLRDEI